MFSGIVVPTAGSVGAIETLRSAYAIAILLFQVSTLAVALLIVSPGCWKSVNENRGMLYYWRKAVIAVNADSPRSTNYLWSSRHDSHGLGGVKRA